MDSWEKLNTKRAYEKLLSRVADDDDGSIKIILPKKCRDENKEMDYREHIYAEAMEKRQAVQREGRKKFATKQWLGSFADIRDDVVRAGCGFVGATLGIAGLGLYVVYEIGTFMTKQQRYDNIIKNFEKPEQSLDIKLFYTDNPDEIRNKILLPHDSLDKLRETRPEAYEELKKLMGGKYALQKYDFVEEFGDKHPEAFKELKTVAMEQGLFDCAFHTRKMK